MICSGMISDEGGEFGFPNAAYVSRDHGTSDVVVRLSFTPAVVIDVVNRFGEVRTQTYR